MNSMRLAFILLCLFVFACKNKNEKQEQYIQVIDFLKGSLRELKSDSLEMERSIQIDSLSETTSVADYTSIAADIQPFLSDEISQGNFEKHFKETSFVDASTNSITFSYQSQDKNSSIKQVDVHILPATESIQYLYITRNGKAGDTAIAQKLLWKNGSHYTLITEYHTDQRQFNRIEKLRWHKKGSAS